MKKHQMPKIPTNFQRGVQPIARIPYHHHPVVNPSPWSPSSHNSSQFCNRPVFDVSELSGYSYISPISPSNLSLGNQFHAQNYGLVVNRVGSTKNSPHRSLNTEVFSHQINQVQPNEQCHMVKSPI